MTLVINALQQGELQRALGGVNRDLVERTRVATGADSDAMKNAAGELRTAWRSVLGRRGEAPSAPGEPPRAKTRQLQRSIQTAVVDGMRRVGSGHFVARLLQDGVVSEDTVIEPRPHGQPALERAADKMTDVFVGTLQRRGV